MVGIFGPLVTPGLMILLGAFLLSLTWPALGDPKASRGVRLQTRGLLLLVMIAVLWFLSRAAVIFSALHAG